MLALYNFAFNLCFINEVFTVSNRKNLISTNGLEKAKLLILLPDLPPKSVINYLKTYPKLKIMKKVSPIFTLVLIIVTCAVSAILFLNEYYGLSATLTCVWIISLTLWIGKAVGLVDFMLNKYFVKNA